VEQFLEEQASQFKIVLFAEVVYVAAIKIASFRSEIKGDKN
jgi:hypothetical protein